MPRQRVKTGNKKDLVIKFVYDLRVKSSKCIIYKGGVGVQPIICRI